LPAQKCAQDANCAVGSYSAKGSYSAEDANLEVRACAAKDRAVEGSTVVSM